VALTAGLSEEASARIVRAVLLFATDTFTIVGLVLGLCLWLGLIATVARWAPDAGEPSTGDGQGELPDS
jgi:hypothetical protein